MTSLFDRAVADKAQDEEAWLRARRFGVTATEVSKLVRAGSVYALELAKEKVTGERTFLGNQYTEWGLAREEVLVEKVLKPEGFTGSDVLFHAVDEPRHLATPDGIYMRDGFLMVAEIKTSKYDLNPEGDYFHKTNYFDQIQWQMYVAGPEVSEALFVWEQHDDAWPEPTPFEPGKAWIDRDESRISELRVAADAFLNDLDEGFEDDPDDYDQLVHDYVAIKHRISEWANELADIEDAIRLRIGERPSFSITTPSGKVTLSTPKPSERFDTSTFKAEHPNLYMQFIKTSQSKPSLRITPAKEAANDIF